MGGASYDLQQATQPQPAQGAQGIFTLNRLVQVVAALQQTTRKTNNLKVLAEGQLTNAKTTLYTVPLNKKAIVYFLSLGNISGGVETPVIYLKPGATSRMIYDAALAAAASILVISSDTAFNLDSGDLIEGKTTNNTAVDFFICGLEE